MRHPSAVLVVDANIIISSILGKRQRPFIDRFASVRTLVTSVRTMTEVIGVLTSLQEDAGQPTDRGAEAFRKVQIIAASQYEHLMQTASESLRRAPASRDGNIRDAHTLALAWALDADIWTHDRDFAGTGWPSWSSANLAAALSAAAA